MSEFDKVWEECRGMSAEVVANIMWAASRKHHAKQAMSILENLKTENDVQWNRALAAARNAIRAALGG